MRTWVMKSTTSLAVAGLLTASSGGLVTADAGGHTVRIEGSLVSGQPTLTDYVCDAGGHCVGNVSLQVEWQGGLSGTSQSRSALAYEPGTSMASFTAFDLFTGDVAGCGHGSMTIVGAITRPLLSPGTGTLSVLEGTGSGDLAGISGQGTYSVTPTSPTTATAEFSLKLRCAGHADNGH